MIGSIPGPIYLLQPFRDLNPSSHWVLPMSSKVIDVRKFVWDWYIWFELYKKNNNVVVVGWVMWWRRGMSAYFSFISIILFLWGWRCLLSPLLCSECWRWLGHPYRAITILSQAWFAPTASTASAAAQRPKQPPYTLGDVVFHVGCCCCQCCDGLLPNPFRHRINWKITASGIILMAWR